MKIVPLGDLAFLLTELDVEPWRLAQALNLAAPSGLEEAVASYDAVAVHIDPFTFDPACLAGITPDPEVVGRRHRIPVCYELGPDLAAAADQLGLPPSAVVSAHSHGPYRCASVGFRPGFAYLGDLADEIAGLPRMSSPRLRVEAGSVGITGRQTGVYPQAGPGGWWVIGRTPLCMVDADSGYYPIQAGDEVVFEPITRSEFDLRLGERL